MSRPVTQSFTCACRQTFDATVYKSANVTKNPALKNRILRREFNVIECPSCHRRQPANIPFLYHDMDRELTIWVYPEEQAAREAEIRAKLLRARTIVASALPAEAAEDEQFGLNLVFGIDSLIARLAS